MVSSAFHMYATHLTEIILARVHHFPSLVAHPGVRSLSRRMIRANDKADVMIAAGIAVMG